MAKYLDCHKELSIQVHPDRATAKHLSQKGGFRLRNSWGKEESFYVVKEAPLQTFHLYLGFEREALDPIARNLRQQLLKIAAKGSSVDLEEYTRLAEELARLVKDELESGIERNLKIDDVRRGNILMDLRRWGETPDHQKRIPLVDIIRFHAKEAPPVVNSGYPALNLLGKDYLFAAIGLIGAMEVIAGSVYNLSATGASSNEPEKLFEQIGLLRFFHKQKVSSGQWLRVPSGVVHAWQGGGNLLVEFAQRSDNTFRIMDWGRELSSSTRRDMHYVEAMYALSVDGVVSDNAMQRFLITPGTESTSSDGYVACHSLLEQKIYQLSKDRRSSRLDDETATTKTALDGSTEEDKSHEEDKSREVDIPKSDGIAVLINPDAPMQVRINEANDVANPPCRRHHRSQ